MSEYPGERAVPYCSLCLSRTSLDRRKRKRLHTDTEAKEVLGSLSGPHILQSMLQDAYAILCSDCQRELCRLGRLSKEVEVLKRTVMTKIAALHRHLQISTARRLSLLNQPVFTVGEHSLTTMECHQSTVVESHTGRASQLHQGPPETGVSVTVGRASQLHQGPPETGVSVTVGRASQLHQGLPETGVPILTADRASQLHQGPPETGVPMTADRASQLHQGPPETGVPMTADRASQLHQGPPETGEDKRAAYTSVWCALTRPPPPPHPLRTHLAPLEVM